MPLEVIFTNDSILDSIKKLLGLDPTYEAFDTDVIIAINTVLMVMQQMGLGPTSAFSISGPNETWSDFFGSEYSGDLEAAKTYTYLRVKAIFDPPQSSSVQQAQDAISKELEWRLFSVVDFK